MKKQQSKKKGSKKIQLQSNNTLDSFLKGKDNSNTVSQKITPIIKIPNNLGYQTKLLYQVEAFNYPQNPQFRDYQFQICMQSVCFNTLVCLPTGLGKTHIATVLIINFAKWFKEGKIIFLAPTRPLVAQQKNSLANFYSEIGEDNVVQITGQINEKFRINSYKNKKIFFCTPQAFQNDLRQNKIDAQKVVLIIFDQAHRAVGNASYCKVVQLMRNKQVGYRLIALSATPGNQPQKIQQVINKLQIKKIIVKDTQDPDVAKYLFTKEVKEIIIKPTAIISQVQKNLKNLMIKPLNHLISLQLVNPYVAKIGSYFAIFQNFRKNKQKSQLRSTQIGVAFSSLRVLKYLYDSLKALKQQGYQTFKAKFFSPFENNIQINEPEQTSYQSDKFDNQISNPISSKNTKSSKNSKPKFQPPKISKGYLQSIKKSQAYQRICQIFKMQSKSKISEDNHPKLYALKNILQQFFSQKFRNYSQQNQQQKNSKVIIFCQLRNTAFQIKQYLKTAKNVKAELFHGQAKTYVKNFVDKKESAKDFEDRNDQTNSIQQKNNRFSLNSKKSEKSNSSLSKESESHTVLHMNQKQQIKTVKDFIDGKINTLVSTSIGQQGLDIGEVDCIFCYDGGMSPIRMIQRMGRTGRKRQGKVFILLMDGKQYNCYIFGKRKYQQMKYILKNKTHKFTYFDKNPSLFTKIQHIPVRVYDNKIKSVKKAYSDVSSSDQDQNNDKNSDQKDKQYQNKKRKSKNVRSESEDSYKNQKKGKRKKKQKQNEQKQKAKRPNAEITSLLQKYNKLKKKQQSKNLEKAIIDQNIYENKQKKGKNNRQSQLQNQQLVKKLGKQLNKQCNIQVNTNQKDTQHDSNCWQYQQYSESTNYISSSYLEEMQYNQKYQNYNSCSNQNSLNELQKIEQTYLEQQGTPHIKRNEKNNYNRQQKTDNNENDTFSFDSDEILQKDEIFNKLLDGQM